MHAWGAVDLRIYLAKKNQGYSISAQSYDFCPRLIQLDILDFTLSHTREHKVSPQSTDPVPLYSLYSKLQIFNKVFLDSRLGPTLS